MNLSSRLRLAKYTVKSAVLARRPALYWALRKRIKGVWEQELLLLPVLCRHGTISVDIGAHFGMYTYEMSRYAGRVLAFEPIPRLAKVLAQGYRKSPNVRVFAMALSDVAGRTTLRVPIAGLGRSTIEASNTLSGMRDPTIPITSVEVEVGRLDDYVDRPVTLIKLDVEGHELSVLRGAERTLREHGPALIIETVEKNSGQGLLPMYTWLAELGYTACALRVPGHEPSLNTLFLRPEHRELLARSGFDVRPE